MPSASRAGLVVPSVLSRSAGWVAYGSAGWIIHSATRQLLDSEVRRIAAECHGRALSTLRQHRDQLDALAHALLEHETLDEPDAYTAAGIPHAHVADGEPARAVSGA